MSIDPALFFQALGSFGLSLPQWYVLAVCEYGPIPHQHFAAEAEAESHGNAFGAITAPQAAEALRSCIDRGLVRVIDADAFQEVREHVSSRGWIGPVYNLPGIGDIDFTVSGVQLYLNLRARIPSDDPITETFTVYADGFQQVYCPTLRAAQGVVDSCALRADLVKISEPIPIGGWCVYWWKPFPSGYLVDIYFSAFS